MICVIFFHQQRASTPVGSQTRIVGNTLVTPILQSNVPQAHQPTSFFTANPAGPSQQTAVGSAGSTNFFNSLQGNHAAAAAAAAAVQPPQGAQHMQSLNTIHIQTAAAAQAQPLQQQQQQHQQHHHQPVHYQSQGTMQYSQAGPVGVGLPYSSQPGTSRHTTHSMSTGVERKPMLDISAASGMSELSYMASPRSSDMHQHVDAKPFSPNRISVSSQPSELQRSNSHSDMPAQATSNQQFASSGHPTVKPTFPNAPNQSVRQPFGHQNQQFQQPQQQQQASYMPRVPTTTQAPLRGIALRPGPPPQQSSQMQTQGFPNQPVPHQLIRFPTTAAQVRFRPPMPQANMPVRVQVSSSSTAGSTVRSMDHGQPVPTVSQSGNFSRKVAQSGGSSKAPQALGKPSVKPVPQASGEYKPPSSEGLKSMSSEREALLASTKAFFSNLKTQEYSKISGKPSDKASMDSSATQSDGSQNKGPSNKN